MPEIPDGDLIDTSTADGQKQWALLCQRAFENLSTDTTVTFEDIDAILTWCLPEYERMTAGKRRESAYQAGREDAARRVLDPLLRLRDIAETDKRGREQDGDREGVMCCVQYLDGLNAAINLLTKLGEDQDTPEGRRWYAMHDHPKPSQHFDPSYGRHQHFPGCDGSVSHEGVPLVPYPSPESDTPEGRT